MTTLRLAAVLSIIVLAFVPACSCSTQTAPDTGPRIDGGPLDTPIGEDVPGLDSGDEDAAVVDTGVPDDVSAPLDTPPVDAGSCTDLPAEPTRPAPIQCSVCRVPGPMPGPGRGECAGDADCTEGMNGRCRFGRGGGFCDYDLCFGDDDCETNEVCLCDGSSSGTGGGNVCVPAECQVNADCNGGFPCSPTLGSCGHYTNFVAYRCHRAEDECQTDGECGGGYCAFDETLGHWACSTSECAG